MCNVNYLGPPMKAKRATPDITYFHQHNNFRFLQESLDSTIENLWASNFSFALLSIHVIFKRFVSKFNQMIFETIFYANILIKSHSAPHSVEVKSRSGSIDVLHTDTDTEKKNNGIWQSKMNIFMLLGHARNSQNFCVCPK